MNQREIKFRVWDNVDYMSKPFDLVDIQSKKTQFASDCKVMRYTGRKDNNHKDLYEGDYITNSNSVSFEIIWDSELSAFRLKREGEGGDRFLYEVPLSEKYWQNGNIYEGKKVK